MVANATRFGADFVLILADKFTAQNFADEAAGKIFDKDDEAWHLVGREAALAEGDNGFGGNAGSVTQGDEGNRLVGNGHDNNFAYFGQFVDDFFDVTGENGRFVIGLPHVLSAAYDLEVAVFIHTGDVVGVQPTIFVYRFFSGGFIVPVALHDLRAAYNEFADLARLEGASRFEVYDAGFGVGEGQTDGADFAVAVNWVAVGNGAGFAEAIAFDKFAFGELLEGFLYFDGQGSSTADAGADRLDVVFAHVGEIVEGDVHGGNAGEQGRLIFFDVLQNYFGVEARQKDHASSLGNGRIHGRRHAVYVAERDDTEANFLAIFDISEPSADLHDIGDEVVMAEGDAFGIVGSATGELDNGRITRFHLDFGGNG